MSALQVAGYFRDSTASRRIPMPLLPSHLGIGQDCVYRDLPCDESQPSPSSASASNIPHPQTKEFNFAEDLCDFPSLKEAYEKRAEAFETIAQQPTWVTDSFANNAAISNSATSSSHANFTVNPSSAVAESSPMRVDPSPQKLSRACAQRKPPLGVISHPFTFAPAYPHSGHRPSTITTYHQSAFETVDYIYFTPARQRSLQGPSKGFHLVSRRALPSTHTLLELGPQPHQFLSSDHLALQTVFQLLG